MRLYGSECPLSVSRLGANFVVKLERFGFIESNCNVPEGVYTLTPGGSLRGPRLTLTIGSDPNQVVVSGLNGLQQMTRVR